MGKRQRRRKRVVQAAGRADSPGRGSLPEGQRMARVNVSPDEWVAFRSKALREQRSVADYLGDLVRRELRR